MRLACSLLAALGFNLLAVAASAGEAIPQIAHKSFDRALDQADLEKTSQEFSLRSSATGITYFEVFAVASPSYGGWEGVSASQSSTVQNHGGGFIDVAVLQYGYGNQTGGRLNGSAGTLYLTETLCGSMSNLHYCSPGETITGWMYYFTFSGATAGLFDASAVSTASPFGSWTDDIYIQ